MTKHERMIRELVTSLASAAGATVTFEEGRKHNKYTVMLNGQRRTRAYTVNTGAHSAGQIGGIKREFAAIIRELNA